MKIRNYGEDFVSSELELVLLPAKDIGFDRSMIGAYARMNRFAHIHQ